MKNLDVIILNVVVILCFITFFISTFRAFDSVNKQKDPKFEKQGIISKFLSYLQSLVNN